MTVLRERQVWKKVKEQPKNRLHVEKMNKLSPEQAANVRIALKVLKIRYGTLQKLAELMHVTLGSLTRVLAAEPNAGLALRIAQVAGVPVDDILTGAFPKPGSCPMCGGRNKNYKTTEAGSSFLNRRPQLPRSDYAGTSS